MVAIFTTDIEVADATAALDRIELASSGTKLNTFFRTDVEEFLQDRAKARFSGEGDDASGDWEPLKASTIRIRRTKGFGAGPINRRSGALRAYVVNAPIYGRMRGDDYSEYLWPSNNPSAQTLRKLKGAQGLDKKNVARPVIAISGKDMRGIMERFMHHLRRAGVE